MAAKGEPSYAPPASLSEIVGAARVMVKVTGVLVAAA